MPINNALKIVFTVISIIVFALLGWYFKTIVIYILVAAVISIIGRPLMKRLRKVQIKGFKIPNSLSAILTLLFFFVVVFGFLAIFIPIISEEVVKISSIDYNKVAESLSKPILSVESFLKEYYLIDQGQSLRKMVITYANNFIQAIEISNVANSILSALGNTLVGFASIIFIAFFFLKEATLFKAMIFTVTPSGYEKQMEAILSESKHLLTRYFFGVIMQLSLISIFLTTGLSLIGLGEAYIPFTLALMVGTFSGFFNIIPYVGPIIGAMFGIMICISSNLELPFYTGIAPMIYKLAGLYIIAQMIDNFILQPYIFSTSVKAHPLEIFIIILASASIGGVTGMIIAIPTYTVLRIVARQFFSEFKIVQNLTSKI